MGDRCFLSLTFRKNDTAKVVEAFGYTPENDIEKVFEVYDETPEKLTVIDCESDGGAWTELNKLADLGVPFYGHHSEGGDYPAGVFCSWEKEYIEVPCVNDQPTCAVGEDGDVRDATKA